MPTNRPIRVAHVAESFAVGGLERLLVEFARHADRERFAPCFVAMGPRGALAEEIEATGRPVHALEEPAGKRPGAILRLARLFRREAIDVVHTHSNGPLLYATPAACLARASRVVHTRHHGPDPEDAPRAIAAIRVVSRWIDRYVCVSGQGTEVAAREGIAPRKIATILNGIDLARFSATGPTVEGPTVVVARLSPEKDIGTLVRAAAIVAGEDAAFRLEVAGDGACMADLRALTRALGLDGRVTFLGNVRDVPALLARARLMVLPSLMEGVSLTLLEAMARGLPVVATRVGGNPEVVAEGVTGLLVPPRSPADLAAAMLRILRDDAEGRRMGREGRARVERSFDVRRMVAAYEALYLKAGRDGRDPRGRCVGDTPGLRAETMA